jgi:hypothetical protein
MRVAQIALLLLVPAGVASAQNQASVALNPKLGVSISDLNNTTADVDTKGRHGFHAGVDFRLGTTVYLQPGVFYQQTGLEWNGLIETYNLDVRGFHFPVLAGVRTGSEEMGFRFSAGPTLTAVSSVKQNIGLVAKDDLESFRWGGMAGVGLDISRLTIDLSGEMGFTRFFSDGSDAKLRTFRLSAGFWF